MILNAQARSQLRKVKLTLDQLKQEAAVAEARAQKKKVITKPILNYHYSLHIGP